MSFVNITVASSPWLIVSSSVLNSFLATSFAPESFTMLLPPFSSIIVYDETELEASSVILYFVPTGTSNNSTDSPPAKYTVNVTIPLEFAVIFPTVELNEYPSSILDNSMLKI